MFHCEHADLAFNFIRSRSKSTTAAPCLFASPRQQRSTEPQRERFTENSPTGPSIAVPSRASRPSGLWNGLPLGVSCWYNLMGGREKTEGKRPVGAARRSPSTLNWCSIGRTWCLEVNYKVVEKVDLLEARRKGRGLLLAGAVADAHNAEVIHSPNLTLVRLSSFQALSLLVPPSRKSPFLTTPTTPTSVCIRKLPPTRLRFDWPLQSTLQVAADPLQMQFIFKLHEMLRRLPSERQSQKPTTWS